MSTPTTLYASDKPVLVHVNGRVTIYATIRTAVLHHNALRDKSGKGASEWPTWLVQCEGEQYHISYNGRVWTGLPQNWDLTTAEVTL